METEVFYLMYVTFKYQTVILVNPYFHITV